MTPLTHSQYFKVGVFALTGLVLVVLTVVMFGAGRFLEQQLLMETYIDESVQGLDVGSAVKHRGVRVGSVESIGFVGDEYQANAGKNDDLRQSRYVLVRFALRPEVFSDMAGDGAGMSLDRLIADGLRVRLASQGLTGTAYLEVDYMDPAANRPLTISWTPGLPYIPSARSIIRRYSQSLGEVLTELQETDIESVARKIDRLAVSANRAIEEAQVGDLRTGIAGLVSELRQTNRHIDELVSSPDVPVLFRNVGKASERLDQVSQRLEDLMAGEELERTRENVVVISEQMRIAAEELPDILARLDRTVRRVDRLVATQEHNVEVTLDNVRVISTNFKAMSESLRRYPGQLIFGEPPRPAETK